MTADDDYKLLQVGIGFTNMVARATKGSADLTRKEIKEGMYRVFISIAKWIEGINGTFQWLVYVFWIYRESNLVGEITEI